MGEGIAQSSMNVRFQGVIKRAELSSEQCRGKLGQAWLIVVHFGVSSKRSFWLIKENFEETMREDDWIKFFILEEDVAVWCLGLRSMESFWQQHICSRILETISSKSKLCKLPAVCYLSTELSKLFFFFHLFSSRFNLKAMKVFLLLFFSFTIKISASNGRENVDCITFRRLDW